VDTFQDNGNLFMVITRVKGDMLEDVFHLMSYDERERLADDLANCVKQLRSIPNSTPYLFADTSGGRMVDHRIPDGGCGPFNTEADFNNHLCHDGVGPDLKLAIASVHSRKHKPYFTHSDLHQTNILVEGGQLSGIVDWECAAFKPEYWEFTKAMYGVWGHEHMEGMMRRAFGYQYSEELEAEQALWRVTPFGI
jgi:aminoglycoside phosphotransferase (APT) family kinase protein